MSEWWRVCLSDRSTRGHHGKLLQMPTGFFGTSIQSLQSIILPVSSNSYSITHFFLSFVLSLSLPVPASKRCVALAFPQQHNNKQQTTNNRESTVTVRMCVPWSVKMGVVVESVVGRRRTSIVNVNPRGSTKESCVTSRRRPVRSVPQWTVNVRMVACVS